MRMLRFTSSRFIRCLPAAGVIAAACAALALANATAAGPAQASSMSGSDLYGVHCARCHTERYPTERTDAQWKTLVMHMRVRANLPAAQAKEILKYLQENSGN